MYPLRTWFVSGMCVWIPCIKETMIMMIMMIIITIIKSTWLEVQYTFLFISHSFLLRMKNISGKCCRENQHTFYWPQLFLENHAVYDTMFRNIVEPEGLQTTIRSMHIACCIHKATNTQSDLFSTAINERTSMLLYAYIAVLLVLR
jgi:hypothetical protein